MSVAEPTEQANGDDALEAFYSALLEDDAEALYERAPCGYLSTTPEGTIIKVNATFVALSGYVSLGSIISAAVFPVAVQLLDPPDQPVILWLDVAVALAIVWLHRANIGRLLKGTENRFGRRATRTARGHS